MPPEGYIERHPWTACVCTPVDMVVAEAEAIVAAAWGDQS